MRESRRRGLTLIEVMVSSTVLAGLSLVLMTAMVPLSTASSEQGALLDMDRTATKVLAELRRELRQSGYDRGVSKFGKTPPVAGLFVDYAALVAPQTQIAFQPRLDSTSFGPVVVWKLEDGKAKRTYPGSLDLTSLMTMADQVANLTFQVATDDQMCVVSLELTRATNRADVTLRRTYVEQIEMMNR